MKTLTVELKNNQALKLLKDLEEADIIRILDKEEKKKKEGSLSGKLRGAISKERANEIIAQTDKMREEWEKRDI